MYSQEQLVDQQISDYLESKYKGFKDRLSKSSPNLKRNGQASLLGANRKVYELIKRLEQLNNKDKYHTYFDELVNAYRKYVEVADVEKKTLGEVMTPITLVEEMLDTLPTDVWSNPNLKWLDPCAGVGTFQSIVVQRLMKGLEEFESNPIKRYRHIIEEMIYVCELQPKNMFIFQCVFDKDDTNELNTYCGSFLDEKFDEHMKNEWGIEKFDIIVGNPPYQTSKEGNKRTQAIWDKFVNKSLDIVVENGYLVMVHPDGWRSADGAFIKLRDKMISKEIQYIKMHDRTEGVKTFGVQTTYDYYCLKNKSNDGFKTTIIYQNNISNIDISNFPFIPNGMFEEYKKLIAKDNEEKVNLLCDSTYHTQRDFLSKDKTEVYKYPVLYITYKDGGKSFWYSSTNQKGHYGLPKVIFSNGISTPFIDYDGEYSVCQYSYGIVDTTDNLEMIHKALLNPKFLEIMKNSDGLTSVGAHRYNRKVIATFRKDFYKQFLND